MRTISILKRKSFIGSLMKEKVYIRDSSSNDLQLHTGHYRKIGVIKNGKKVSFNLPESELILLVIMDKFSAAICNDKIIIPAGTENIDLTGKNKLILSVGNPFIFDK